jgi:hypothetical protein
MSVGTKIKCILCVEESSFFSFERDLMFLNECQKLALGDEMRKKSESQPNKGPLSHLGREKKRREKNTFSSISKTLTEDEM